MKIVSFGPPGAEQPGVLREDGRVVPTSPLLVAAGLTALSTNAVLGLLPHLQPIIEAGMASAAALSGDRVRLGPPVPHPPKIIVTGANYQSHLDEVHGVAPREPLLYFKPSNIVIGPHDPLPRHPLTDQLDYEIELGVVIGRGGINIARADAFDHVAGYLICNDVTARDMAFKDVDLHPVFAQIARAKGIVAGAPTGPWLVTKDEIPEPDRLRMQCWVNDELRQDGNTEDMLFDIPTMIASFTEVLRLEPGDVIMTGTCAGSGAARTPPSFLTAGDSIRMTIDGLGTMLTPVTDPADTAKREKT